MVVMAPADRDLRALLDANRAAISAAVRRHKGRSVAIFGSVARGEAGPASDVDFLVDFEEDSSLFDLLHLIDDLERLLGRRVDVLSTRALKPRDEHIRREAVAL